LTHPPSYLLPQQADDSDQWFYLSILLGLVVIAISAMNYFESIQQKQYEKIKLEAKLKEEEKAKVRKKISSTLLAEEEREAADGDTTAFSENAQGSNQNQEVHKAEGVMRSNSSFVEMT
jgi:hypothetical protein